MQYRGKTCQCRNFLPERYPDALWEETHEKDELYYEDALGRIICKEFDTTEDAKEYVTTNNSEVLLYMENQTLKPFNYNQKTLDHMQQLTHNSGQELSAAYAAPITSSIIPVPFGNMKIKQTTTDTSTTKRDLSENSANAVLEPPKRFKSAGHADEDKPQQSEPSKSQDAKSRKAIVSDSDSIEVISIDSVEVISSDTVEVVVAPPKLTSKKKAPIVITTTTIEIEDDDQPKPTKKTPSPETVQSNGSFIYPEHKLSDQEFKIVRSVLYEKISSEVATTVNGQAFTCYSLRTLKHEALLDGDVLSAYMWICGRRIANKKVSYQSTYFYQQLVSRGYDRVATISRKQIVSSDMTIFPMNVDNNHWILGVLNFKEMKIELYDSMYNDKRIEEISQKLRDYLKEVAADKSTKMMNAIKSLNERGSSVDDKLWTVYAPTKQRIRLWCLRLPMG
jgi:Ulp1 family protease